MPADACAWMCRLLASKLDDAGLGSDRKERRLPFRGVQVYGGMSVGPSPVVPALQHLPGPTGLCQQRPCFSYGRAGLLHSPSPLYAQVGEQVGDSSVRAQAVRRAGIGGNVTRASVLVVRSWLSGDRARGWTGHRDGIFTGLL